MTSIDYCMIEKFLQEGEIMNRDCLRDEVRKLAQHPLTYFPVRGIWYVSLRRHLIDLGDALKETETSKERQIDFLQSIARQERGDNRVILFGDIALLTYANDLKHEYGDNLFCLVASHIRSFLGEFYWGSYGGDELVAFGDAESLEYVWKKISIFNTALGDSDVTHCIPNFAEHKIKPRFNIGVATLSEACLLTASILDKDLNVHEKDAYNLLVDTCLTVADIRTSVYKALGHIQLVLDLLASDRARYNQLKPFILKGCIGISSVQLWQLFFIRKFCTSQVFEKKVLHRVLAIMKKRARSPCDVLITDVALSVW